MYTVFKSTCIWTPSASWDVCASTYGTQYRSPNKAGWSHEWSRNVVEIRFCKCRALQIWVTLVYLLVAWPSFFHMLHAANVYVGVNSVFESLLSNISSMYKETKLTYVKMRRLHTNINWLCIIQWIKTSVYFIYDICEQLSQWYLSQSTYIICLESRMHNLLLTPRHRHLTFTQRLPRWSRHVFFT